MDSNAQDSLFNIIDAVVRDYKTQQAYQIKAFRYN